MTTNASTKVLDLSFRSALLRLDANGMLLKVDDEIDPEIELSSIMFEQPERAMLFKNVKGYDMPVMGNFMGSEENVLTIFQKDVRELRHFITEGLGNPMPPKKVDSGVVQEVFHNNPDLTNLLPLLRYAPEDGGRYISAGVVISKDPESGVFNASYHRFMHLEQNRLLI
ncbi:MAG: UbiD family decarboxylase, partial [Desulfatiglandales bacterium]